MKQVATLAELDLGQVLGFGVSAETVADLLALDARLHRLESGLRRNGWCVGDGERTITAGQPWPIVLDRTLSYPAAPDDTLELALNVWQRDVETLVVDVTVDVYCFCTVDHHIHQPAEREWTVRGEAVRDAMASAVSALEGWVELGLDADQWRARAGLPARPGAL